MGFKFTDRICVIEVEDKKYPVVFQKPLVDRLGSIKDTFLSLKNDGGADEEKDCDLEHQQTAHKCIGAQIPESFL